MYKVLVHTKKMSITCNPVVILVNADGTFESVVDNSKVVTFNIYDRSIHNWSWQDDMIDQITVEEEKDVYKLYKCIDPEDATKKFSNKP